ncbi:quinone-dependent dihydroorotate dehydrogenase [Candidatus Woesearchaeota archaeon]|nr:quinone-dependent dihydroorotate dehydrogenase [Candidatus Woesearchaeota archaeon]
MYQRLIKPILFRSDPEKVHDRATNTGIFLGKHAFSKKIISTCFAYSHPSLVQKIHNITFQNPVGLAAGFDKNANLMDILPSIGFGFEEIGSVTAKPCAGNPAPRLWRVPERKSLVVYYGLKNEGCHAIAKKIHGRTFKFPLGISIAKTNCAETCDAQVGVDDYVEGFRVLEPYANYLTINISCPNAYGGQPFTDPNLLEMLLAQLDTIPTTKPIFIKFSPDLTLTQVDDLLQVINQHRIHGLIISNLVKDRSKANLSPEILARIGPGGLSGKIVEPFANDMISYIYQKTKGKYTLVGCGGIFNAQDAYEKICRGASLVQLITGMVYEGPALIGKVNKSLVELLKKDGFTNISQAVGSKNHLS